MKKTAKREVLDALIDGAQGGVAIDEALRTWDWLKEEGWTLDELCDIVEAAGYKILGPHQHHGNYDNYIDIPDERA